MDKVSEFYEKLIKTWLNDNNLKTLNERTYVTAVIYAENNNHGSKFKADDHMEISKYKNIFEKAYTLNWSEKKFVTKNIQTAVPRSYIINDLNSEKITGTFCEKELKQKNKREFRMKKVVKKKGDKMYPKLKVYHNWSNSCIVKKDIITKNDLLSQNRHAFSKK